MPAPQALDFRDLQDGVVRNNVGVDAMVLGFVATTANGIVTASATGQQWRLEPGEDGGTGAFTWFLVTGLDTDSGEVALRPLGRTRGPGERPSDLPTATRPR